MRPNKMLLTLLARLRALFLLRVKKLRRRHRQQKCVYKIYKARVCVLKLREPNVAVIIFISEKYTSRRERRHYKSCFNKMRKKYKLE